MKRNWLGPVHTVELTTVTPEDIDAPGSLFVLAAQRRPGRSVADIEKEASDTLEKGAERRRSAHAERWHGRAESVRQHAAKERGLSNQLSNDRGRQRRRPAGEWGPSAAARGEDAKEPPAINECDSLSMYVV